MSVNVTRVYRNNCKPYTHLHRRRRWRLRCRTHICAKRFHSLTINDNFNFVPGKHSIVRHGNTNFNEYNSRAKQILRRLCNNIKNVSVIISNLLLNFVLILVFVVKRNELIYLIVKNIPSPFKYYLNLNL